MKRTLLVNWNESQKQWIKYYQGKKYYLGTGKGVSDRESYNRAVAKFNAIKKTVDAGGKVTSTRTVLSGKKPKKKKTRQWNPRRVSSCIRKFLKQKMDVAVNSDGEEISYGRVQNLKNRLQHFHDYFKDDLMSQITGVELDKWSIVNARRVHAGEIQPSTLRQDYRAVRQLFKWTYKQHIINSLPRTLEDLGKQTKTSKKKQKKRKRHLFFTKKEIQKLYAACDSGEMNPKWKNRQDTDSELLKLAIVLGLNTGMTQQDLSDLVVDDLYMTKRPARCIRQRSKTGEDSNHILWRESVKLLKSRIEGKRFGEKVLLRRDGRELIVQTEKNGKKTGGRSDALGASFTRLVKRVFGEDDPRRFRELRRTSAEMCKNRMPGTERLFLSHADGRMSSFYTTPAQKQFDLMLTYLEMDLGFSETLMRLPARKQS